MAEVLELIAKYSQSRVKDLYGEIDEIQLDEIRNMLRSLSNSELKKVLGQVILKNIPESVKKEVIFEYVHRGGKLESSA
ncbi:MAG: hypothetical protein QXL86_00120 [Candidatus Aenigmatarchaeota archaeon]